jgi:tetratricopeptide (TPR) repeat protein
LREKSFDFIAGTSVKQRTIPALLYLVVSAVSTQLPLLNYLGYEFSVVIALVASCVSGFLTIRWVKKALGEAPSGLLPSNIGEAQTLAATLLDVFTQALLFSLALLLIPLVVMLTNAVFVKNCSLLQGLGFFLLLPVVSVVFSCSLGLFCAVHYRRARTMFTLVFVATIVYAALAGYFTPAIFSYNFFYGYFPGLTYDEALGIGWTLVLFRLLTLALAAAFVWMALLLAQNAAVGDTVWNKGVALLAALLRGRNVFITSLIATILIVTWWFRGELGFESSARFIQRRLGDRVETEHFSIFYSKESYDREEIVWIAAEHEFRLYQVNQFFSLPFRTKIESYIYPSSDVKQRLMGAGNTNIAKPWSKEVHITKQSLDATLKHELVHVVAAPFGLPVIKASLSTGLVEGLAEAIDWNWGNRTLHQYAAAMYKFGVAPDISRIMAFTGFAAQSSSLSYVLAGSFCRFVIDTYGIRSMMHLYRTNDYEEVFGKTSEELMVEWRAFLRTIPVDESDRDAIEVLFRRPPIFRKVCARVIASRNAEAAKKLNAREYAAAASLYMQSYEEGKGYDALSGYLASVLRGGNFPAVTAAFDTIIRPSNNPAHYLPLFVNIGLAEIAEHKVELARQLFSRVVAADVSEPLTETALVCDAATRDTTNLERLLRYFISAPSDSQRVAMLDSMTQDAGYHWLPLYLKGKVLLRLARWQETLEVMNRLAQAPLERRLHAIRLKTMGSALFRLRRFEEAKIEFWKSLNSLSTEVAKNEVNEWIERCEWMERNVGTVR